MPVPLLGQTIRRRHSAVDEERGGRVIARHRSGQSNVEADALSRISWPKVLDGTDTVDVENMDTHIVNAIITGARSKSSLIESISTSAEIVPK